MKGKKLKRAAGYSIIVLSGVVHKFLVEDKSHPRYQDICLSLREMTVIMKGQLDSDPTMDLEI